MHGLIRPELLRAAIRWRETLTGGALALIGLWIALTTFAAFAILGWLILAAGGALALSGIPRARFRNDGGGAGLVELDEGSLTYLAPGMGGALAIDGISRVELAPGGRAGVWILTGVEGRLTIPVDAAGAEQLFDVFNALPGLAPGEAARLSQSPPRALLTVWRKAHRTLPPAAH